MDRGQEPLSGTPAPLPAQATSRLFDRIDLAQVYPTLMVLLVCIGIGIRLRAYLFNRSLWLDESLLALNIVNRSFSALLLEPLGLGQAAPPGFLVAQRLAVQAFGSNEYALRLVPLLSGVLSLLLFAYLAKRWLSPTGALVAVGLFALSDLLIYYSTEAKQYSSDVAVGLLLCCFAVCCESRPVSSINSVALAVGGAIAIWFSHPAVFVLAGVALYLAVPYFVHKEWGKLGRLFVVCLVWAASLAACYFVSLRQLAASQFLLDYWEGSFWPLPPRSVPELQWPIDASWRMLSNLVHPQSAGLLAFLCILGCGAIFLRQKLALFILLSPLVLALFASALHKYPFDTRLMLFAAPAVLWLVGEGTGWLTDHISYHKTFMAGVIFSLLFFAPLLEGGIRLIKPRTHEEIKPVLAYVQEHWQAGDSLYLYYEAGAAFKFYAERYGFRDKNYVYGIRSKDDWSKYPHDLAKLRGRGRVWILFSHVVVQHKGMDEEEFFLDYLDTIGVRLDAFKAPLVSVYLYDLRPAASTG
jgi:hypothetical protein